MGGCVHLVLTDVSEEHIASIFRAEKSASGEPVFISALRISESITENLERPVPDFVILATILLRG
jgi:hypothetical protein